MESFERACGRSTAIVPWLPAVLALSLNSPYLEGEETGALSARAARLLELPRGGQPPPLRRRRRLGGRDRGDRRRLHAQLVGRPAASAPRHARGADRRPADERRPLGGARRARPGALCRRPAPARSRDGYLERRAAAARLRRRPSCSRSSSRRRGSSARGSSSRRCASRSRRCASSRSGRRDGLEAVAAELVDARRDELLRAALYPLRLVGARLGRRSAPVVLVVLGIAAGAAVVFGGRAGRARGAGPCGRAGDRADPGGSALGAGGLVRHARRRATSRSPCSSAAPALRSRHAGAGDATSLVLFRETHDRGRRSPGSAASRGSGAG